MVGVATVGMLALTMAMREFSMSPTNLMVAIVTSWQGSVGSQSPADLQRRGAGRREAAAAPPGGSAGQALLVGLQEGHSEGLLVGLQ